MSSKLLAVRQRSETAYTSLRVPDSGSDNELIRINNKKLEALAMRIAWAFGSIVVLLAVLSLLLVVAGYAGSRFSLP